METRAMTVSQQLLDSLNSLFSKKYHSLARYILDARPYVPAGMEGVLHKLEAIADSDQRFADRLAETIESLEGVPQLAIFHPEVASLNYLALDYLRGVLVKDLQADLAEAEQAAARAEAGEHPAAAELLKSLASATRDQLQTL